MMVYFGPKVIGEEAFRAQQQETRKLTKLFGPAILEHPKKGEGPVEKQERKAEVVSTGPEPDEPEESLSVRAVKEALKDSQSPAVIDRFCRNEFFRPDGPRSSVLELLLQKERGREDTRPEVVEALEAKIAELKQ